MTRGGNQHKQAWLSSRQAYLKQSVSPDRRSLKGFAPPRAKRNQHNYFLIHTSCTTTLPLAPAPYETRYHEARKNKTVTTHYLFSKVFRCFTGVSRGRFFVRHSALWFAEETCVTSITFSSIFSRTKYSNEHQRTSS